MSKKTAKKKQTNSAKSTKEMEFIEDINGIRFYRKKNDTNYYAQVWNEAEADYVAFDARTDDYALAKIQANIFESELNFDWDNTHYINDRKICNGNVLLFRRKRSRKWQAKIRRSVGKWVDYTTGSEDLEEAKQNAEELYRDIKYRQETGKVDISKKFGDVCRVAKRQLLAEYEKTNRTQLKDKARVIDKYLLPILANYNTHNITYEVLLEFDEKREQIAGKQLSKSTIATHNSALSYCFELAKLNNYIIEVPSLPKSKAVNKTRRLHFTNSEYRKLCNFMWRDLQKREKLINTSGIDIRTYEIGELLRDVVLILANTGIRAGNELLNLKWNNIRIVEKDGIESVEFNLVKTKTHLNRKLISFEPQRKSEKDKRYGSWSALERIRDRFEDTKELNWEELTKKDIYIFRLKTSKKVVRTEALTKNFKKLLQRADLLKDENGNDRVLYSLRHTYASRRRYDGWSFDDLADVMGTSVKLVQSVYSHFEVSNNPNKYSGHLQRQKKQKEDSAEARSISTEARSISMEKSLEQQAKQLEKQTKQIAKLLAHNEKLTDKLIETKH